jgi:ornithine carbamoyltransferase
MDPQEPPPGATCTGQIMVENLKQRSMKEFAAMSEPDRVAMLGFARELHTAARSGAVRLVLRGKNIALLCDAAYGASDDAAIFKRAASELGARMANLRLGLSSLSTPGQVQHTSKLLGRLYDALECVGMPSDLVNQIGAAAGVPVFEALSSRGHPAHRLADRLNDLAANDDNRCAIIQAVLVSVLV